MATATDAMQSPPTGSRYQQLRCGVRGPNGLSDDQVKEHQRTRLYEAMVEIAAARGYQATTIKAMCGLAGVARQTFYDLFGGDKEACFLGAYDYVVARAAERISLAYRGEDDPERRLCRAFEQFAWEAASEPQAARFALLEPFAAGQAAFARMDRGREMFEDLIAASISSPSRGVTLSPTIAKGIVGGVERVSRVYLLVGKIGELSATADELSAWVSCYRPWSRSTPAQTSEAATRPQAGLRGKDDGLRILRAAAAIAARDGYSGLSAARIARLAGVSEETFASLYNGADAVEACFLAAFDLLGVEALVCAARASRDAGGWPDGVRSGIAALLDHVAGHPFLGPVAFIEIFSVGPSAIERRSRMLQKFADVFTRWIPDSQRPSELVAEAIVGAIWAVVHDYIVRGHVDLLHELADDATYLALAPVIGHEFAIQLILGDRGSARPAGRAPSPPSAPPLNPRRQPSPAERCWSDPDVPLVVIDLASVETYFLVRPLSGLAVEQAGAVWCPLISEPAQLDLDVDAARACANRLQLPFVRPETHHAPVPRAMRLAALASQRGRCAIWTVRATRVAWATGADLARLGEDSRPQDEDAEDDLEGYLELMAREIGLDLCDAKLAAEEGSQWDLELHSISRRLARLGIHSAPALRWRGNIYTGLDAISAVLADSGIPPTLA
jgi:AcrR family transcriptional regulator/2-hydroxychromene-2-carboxylate isomerase